MSIFLLNTSYLILILHLYLTFLVIQRYVTTLKSVRMVMHKYELAYGDDIDHKFLHIDHNKNQHFRCVTYGVLHVQEYNPTLILNLE